METKGKKKVKLIIFSKALKLHQNTNLEDELNIISVAENVSQRNDAVDIQKRKKNKVFKAFETKTRKFNKTRALDEHYKYDEPEIGCKNESKSKEKNFIEASKNIILKGE